MTINEFLRRFPHASRSTLEANVDVSTPEPEPAIRDEPLATEKREKVSSRRPVVSITSYRCRLTDPDNLCPKYLIDALRYAGCLYDDREQDIILQVSQERVGTKAEQKTEVEIVYENLL